MSTSDQARSRRTSSKYLPYVPPASAKSKRSSSLHADMIAKAIEIDKARKKVLQSLKHKDDEKVLGVKYAKIEEIKESPEVESDDSPNNRSQRRYSPLTQTIDIPSINNTNYYNDALDQSIQEVTTPQPEGEVQLQILNTNTVKIDNPIESYDYQEDKRCCGLIRQDDSKLTICCKVFWLIPTLPFVLIYQIFKEIIYPMVKKCLSCLATCCKEVTECAKQMCNALLDCIKWIIHAIFQCLRKIFCVCKPFYKCVIALVNKCLTSIIQVIKKVCDYFFETIYLIFRCIRAIFVGVGKVANGVCSFIYRKIIHPISRCLIQSVTYILDSIKASLRALGKFIRWICDGISWIFSKLFQIIKPLFTYIYKGIKFVVTWFYKIFIRPVFRLINYFCTYFCKACKMVCKLIWRLFKGLLTCFHKVFLCIYEKIILPLYQAIKCLLTAIYKVAKWIANVIWKIIHPIFEAIGIIIEEIYYAIASLFGVRRNPEQYQ